MIFVTTEARWLVHIDALPDWDFIRARKTATGVSYVFPKEPFPNLIVNMGNASIRLQKYQRVATESLSPLSIFHNKFKERFLYPADPSVTEVFNFVFLQIDRQWSLPITEAQSSSTNKQEPTPKMLVREGGDIRHL